jgi:hypothetical protein
MHLGSHVSSGEEFRADRARTVVRACLRPLGYLAFVLAVAALTAAARLLGAQHELGFFAGRLSETIRRYPEVTRKGVQMAWVSWLVLLALAASPIDPIASRWDEVVLVAIGAAVLWRRSVGARPSER